MMRQRRFGIYLQYYEGGDLANAVDTQFARTELYLTNRWQLDLIPETFIWKVARSLVTACQILQYGCSGIAPVAAASWQPITHLDMSLASIFMQPPALAGRVSRRK